MSDAPVLDLHAEIERLRAEVETLRRRVEAAEAAADHDVLTPTLNRRGFIAEMNRTVGYCTRHGVPAVLIYLDLDGFKAVNDRLGHAAGDAALIWVAERMKITLRDSDTVGRLGGDEFGLLLLNAGLDEGRDKAARLSTLLSEAPFHWQGRQIHLGGSFGVRAWSGHADAEVWLAEADAAMWISKRGR